LTSAVLDYGMRSMAAGGKRLEDAAMEVSYAAPPTAAASRILLGPLGVCRKMGRLPQMAPREL
jgi:hypothetical protein